MTKRTTALARLAAGAAAALVATAAQSTAVTVTTPFMNLENRGINSVGFSVGQFMRIGANNVVPNGQGPNGTTGIGTTTHRTTGATVTRTIPFAPSPVIPNFFSRLLPDDPNLYGPWTL